jgi:hypothetical protein
MNGLAALTQAPPASFADRNELRAVLRFRNAPPLCGIN